MKSTKHQWIRRILVVAIAGVTTLTVASSAQAAIPVKPARTWGTNGRVNIILPVGDQIFIGGEFTAVIDTSGDSHPANNIAVFSATTGAFDLTWQGSANNTVTALTTANGLLYAGGLFSKMDGVTATRLAALDLATGTLNTTWTPQADQPVDVLAVAGSSVFAAGAFLNITDANGKHARSYVAKLDATTGMLDTGWTPAPNARVRGLAVNPAGDQIYLAGDFKKFNNLAAVKIVAEVSTATPAVLAPFRAGPTNNSAYAQIFDIATDGTALYEAVGGSGGACTAMDLTTGARIWSKHTNGNLQSVRVANGLVYCGGHYGGSTSFDGLPRQKIAVVTEAAPYTTTSFNPNIDSPLGVWAVGVDANHLYLGGDFSTIQSVSTPGFAEFIDTSIQSVPTAPVLTATPGDTIVHLDWDPPSTDGGSTVKNYSVYRRIAVSGSFALLATVKTGSAYDDTAVINNTTYDYYVTANNALGSSPASATSEATPVQFIQSAPTAPLNFLVTGGTGKNTITWSQPASTGNSPITGFNIYRGDSNSGGSGSETLLTQTPLGGLTLSYTDTAITAGVTYYYYATALNAFGESGPTAEGSATPTAGVPGLVTLSATTEPGVVHVTWTPAAYDGGSPVTKYVIVRDNVRLVNVNGVDTLNYDDFAVNSGETHTYQVRAVNAVGTGGYSNKVTVTLP